MVCKLTLALLGVQLLACVLAVGRRDNRGTEFVLAFGDNIPWHKNKPNDMDLFITTQEPKVRVTVKIPKFNSSFEVTQTILKGQTQAVSIPHEARHFHTEESNKAVHVRASGDVSVYCVNKEERSSDAFMALPVDVLGTEYVAMTYFHDPIIVIAAVEDDTVVNITLPKRKNLQVRWKDYDFVKYSKETVAAGGKTTGSKRFSGGKTIQVKLDRFGTFEAFQLLNDADFTGAKIVSNKPIFCSSGNRKVSVPKQDKDVKTKDELTKDHLIEQLMPVDTWGKEFVTFSTPDRNIGDLYRFLANEDDTVINIHGMDPVTLQAGQYHEMELPTNDNRFVQATKGISVAMFSKTYEKGGKDGANLGDPSFYTVIPIIQYDYDYSWITVFTDWKDPDLHHKVACVIRKDQMNGLRLDGNADIDWRDITEVQGAEDYVCMNAYVEEGSHHLYHVDPTVTFMVTCSGTGLVNSYGYPAGYRMSEVNGPCDPAKYHPIPGDVRDNDCDGAIDEEKLDGIDNDGDGLVDEDTAISDTETATCRLTGDPHLTTFEGETASLSAPCNFKVSRFIMYNHLPFMGTDYDTIEVKIYGGNSQTTMEGQFFISDVFITVQLMQGDSEGPMIKLYTSERRIEDPMLQAWHYEENEDLLHFVKLDFLPHDRLATMHIEGTSLTIEFRPVDRTQGREQTFAPGIFLTVSKTDLVDDSMVSFPRSQCSTLDDDNDFSTLASDYGLVQHSYIGLYSMMEQHTRNIKEGDQDPMCPELLDLYKACPEASKTDAINKCASLMHNSGNIRCLENRYPDVRAIETFKDCVDAVCNNNSEAAARLMTYRELCSDFPQLMQP